MDVVRLTVLGDPIPRRMERSGRRYYLSKRSEEYRERIQTTWLIAGRPRLGNDWLTMRVSFFYARPASHSRKDGSLKEYAPAYPPKGDSTNLVKGLEDALNGLLYEDDKQIVHHEIWRLYATETEGPRTELQVSRMDSPYPASV